VPAQDDLGRRLAEVLRDVLQLRVVEDLALREWRPRLRGDPVRAAVGVDLAVLEAWRRLAAATDGCLRPPASIEA
jgi:hypothetical protein